MIDADWENARLRQRASRAVGDIGESSSVESGMNHLVEKARDD